VIPPERVAEVMWREDDASRALGITLEELGLGRARLSMQVQKSMANGQKVCHGGFIFTLADTAFGYASNTHNQRTVSASCSIDYLAPVFLDDRLTAEASEVLRGGRRGIYDVKVTNQKGETVALFRGHAATIKGKWIE
jgi:acyl-CoA thioesterase